MRQHRLMSTLFAALIGLGLLFWGVSPAQAERIRSFHADVRLEEDTWVDVVETVVYDFESAERRGIFREIPVKYTRHNMPYKVRLDVVSVQDETGAKLQYKVQSQGKNIRIRIGDPKRYVTGQQTYRIHYRLLRAVNFFDGEPEVYWNVTGNGWPVPIDRASARFYPGELAAPSALRLTSFYGPYGAQTSAAEEVGPDHVAFAAEGLSAGHGLTFAVRLPAGVVAEPSLMKKIGWWLGDWWLAGAIPLGTFFMLFGTWRRTGRDEGRKKPVAVEWYPPEELTPAEVGVLIDEHCDSVDIISILFDLAVRGYLLIVEDEGTKGLIGSKKSSFHFIRTFNEAEDDKLTPYEQVFLEGLFRHASRSPSRELNILLTRAQSGIPGDPAHSPLSVEALEAGEYQFVELSDLREKFYTYVNDVTERLYQTMVTKDLFLRNPEEDRSRYSTRGVLVMVIGIILAFFGGDTLPALSHYFVLIGIGLGISGVIIMSMSRLMPARSKFGSEKLHQAQGFQRFVKMVEKPRLEAMREKDPHVFGRLLPYAMVLGVGEKWAEGFEGLLSEPPEWYYSSSPHRLSSVYMVNNLNRNMGMMSSTMKSAPQSTASSGGSGFSGGGSGGGFGGGGGGSW